ncbi:MAG: protein translocase subunit SecF [Ruminococcus sp.]|nr:protein translocase subunit SecF [Ruminococcus sp.]
MDKEKKVLDVVGHRKLFYCISIGLIVLFIVLTFVLGLNVDIQFKGGTIITYSYKDAISVNDVKQVVSDTLGQSSTVTTGKNTATGQDTVKIQLSSTQGINEVKQNELKEALLAAFPDNELELVESSDVNASNGLDFFLKCIVAVIFAMIVTIIYIGFRFRKIGGISAGLFSVVALFHDLCMVYGSFVIFRFDINANFMAVLLTILGYSINATIIIYDRIRENQGLIGSKTELEDLVNLSITQTLGRSIHTTVTTVAAMATVCVVCALNDVTSILSFALPLIVGMLAGVYSSNCIAPTLWVMWRRYREKNPSKKKTKTEPVRQGRR